MIPHTQISQRVTISHFIAIKAKELVYAKYEALEQESQKRLQEERSTKVNKNDTQMTVKHLQNTLEKNSLE